MNRRYLILLDAFCCVEYDRIEIRTIKQFLSFLLLYKDFNAGFTVVNRSRLSLNTLIPPEVINEFGICFIEEKSPWQEYDFNAFDVIIVHSDIESAYVSYITDTFCLDIHILEKSYVFDNYQHATSYLNSISDFLNKHPKKCKDITLLKKELDNFFDPNLKLINENVIKKIEESTLLTLKKNKRFIHKISVVSGFYQKFYLGDSCFWFYDLQLRLRLILKYFPFASIQVIHTDYILGNRLKKIFKNSFHNSVDYKVISLSEVILDEFDLIIVNQREFFKILFLQISQSKDVCPILWTPTYYQSNNNEGFSEQLKFKRNINFESLQDKLRYNKKHYLTLPIKREEIKWGNQWMERRGVFDRKVMILPYNASTNSKLLSSQEFFNLVEFLVLQKGFYVLTFDENRQNLKGTFREKLRLDVFNNVIIVEEIGGIRKEMALMASDYVCGLIAPCTGISHIFNGIRLYLQNYNGKDFFYLIYTGKAPETDPDYHPLKWWNFNDIYCIVNCLKDGKNYLASKKNIPKSIKAYKKLVRPTYTITADQIIGFMKEKLILDHINE